VKATADLEISGREGAEFVTAKRAADQMRMGMMM